MPLPTNPASCASAEELLFCELEQALADNDVHTARQKISDPIFRGLPELATRQSLEDSLFVCCEAGHAESVALLLGIRVSCMARLKDDGSTVLHCAAKHCRAAIVEQLLDARADPRARMRHKITPLLWACERAEGIDVVRLLLERRAMPDDERDPGGHPLSAAASWGHTEIVQLLLDARASVEGPGIATLPALSAAGSSAAAALSTAPVPSSIVDVSAAQLRAAASPPALWSSCAQGHMDVARVLLAAGADPNRTTALPNNQGVDPGTPLHAAAAKGHTDLVRLLLGHNALPEVQKRDGATPLSLAAHHGHAGVLSLLLHAGARDGHPPGSLMAKEAALLAAQKKGWPAGLGTPSVSKNGNPSEASRRHALCLSLLSRAEQSQVPPAFREPSTGSRRGDAKAERDEAGVEAEVQRVMAAAREAAAREAAAREAKTLASVATARVADYMRDPVITSDGQTYERRAIEAWLSRRSAQGLPPTSPLTGEPLSAETLVPNVILRGLIADLLERRPELLAGAAFANV